METGNTSSQSIVNAQSPYFCGAGIVLCFVISQSGFPDEEKNERYLFSRDSDKN